MNDMDKKVRKYSLLCPCCKARLMDIKEGIKALADKNEGDIIFKCQRCKNIIGIRLNK